MSLMDIYTENFTTNEIIALINAYATMVNDIGPDYRLIRKLDTLMEALEEKIEERC